MTKKSGKGQKNKLGFLDGDDDDEDTFVPGQKPGASKPPAKNAFAADSDEDEGFVPAKKAP